MFLASIASWFARRTGGADTVRFILGHAGTKVLITDRELSPAVARALDGMDSPPLVIDVDDPMCGSGERRAAGFNVTHLYGLTETCGPATVCAWQEAWDALDMRERAARMARQGVHEAQRRLQETTASR